MDIDSFQKGGNLVGKGDHRKVYPNKGGKGNHDNARSAPVKPENLNKDKECFLCCKKGHVKKDWWWKDQPEKMPKGGKKSYQKGRKKCGPKEGKGAGALDDDLKRSKVLLTWLTSK